MAMNEYRGRVPPPIRAGQWASEELLKNPAHLIARLKAAGLLRFNVKLALTEPCRLNSRER